MPEGYGDFFDTLHEYSWRDDARAGMSGLAENRAQIGREARQARSDAYHFHLDEFPPGPARFALPEKGTCNWCRRDAALARNGLCEYCCNMMPGIR